MSLSRNRIIAILLAVLVIAIAAKIVEAQRFRVTGTNPPVNNFANVSPDFQITFSKDLSASGISITTNPSILNSYSVRGKMLDLKIAAPLNTGTAYTVEIQSVQATDGKSLHNLTFNFTPKDIPANELTPAEQQVLMNSQDKNQGPSNDPIVDYLPHTTLSYTLTAVVSGQGNTAKLTLNAAILLNQSEMTNEAAAVQQNKQDIANYITSLGLNPASYTIHYTIQTP